MKNTIIAVILLAGTFAFAQNDKIITTQNTKTTVVEDGEIINKKVKVVTEKTQDVTFDKSQKHQLNQDRVPAPVLVTKTVMVDNDKDPFYDKIIKVKYYNQDNKKYAFKAEGNSLNISYFEGETEVQVGKAVRSKYNNYYLITAKEMNGIGYFTKDNNFVMEYYNAKTDDTDFLVFEDVKF